TSVDIVKNIERMGDITTNIAGFYERIFENRGTFSDEAQYDLEMVLIPRNIPLHFTYLYHEVSSHYAYLGLAKNIGSYAFAAGI
ncbi:hypothetical protein PT100_08865, partial [Erysipelothrix rhusiopathiae]|nr:hypothetical protein [Erysipelothrix rhusiopathiae]